MFGLIDKYFGDKVSGSSGSESTAIDADIALCVLLLEAAHADGECSAEEKEQIITTLVTAQNIDREKIDTFLKKSDEQRKEAVDLFQFTRFMNNNLSKQEKIEVMEAVWRIILIDGQLEKHEDHFAHQLANLLRLNHKELIDAKVKARAEVSK